ncbi:hypothetical protein P872_01275 [Rhodonellum psychrophilum GCM71 = DSM 17998]|uniref:Uncharacterized protein n=1 Tax=Rhodonellum psychrophilum GCM71 = DSM 17998 TaxID=1123057 RepID=U5C2A2_9BACT|nr:hypothetical protein P872_01275 [Rhodonellum psychrophilum GCM71 = DSM 17998]
MAFNQKKYGHVDQKYLFTHSNNQKTEYYFVFWAEYRVKT